MRSALKGSSTSAVEKSNVTPDWLVLCVVAAGAFLSAFAGSSTNLTLPRIGMEFHVGAGQTGWVVETYLLAVTTLLLLGGRAGDMFTHRRIYLVGQLLFGLFSLFVAAAWSFPILLAGRALQGAAGAMIMAVGPALLTTNFPPQLRGRALGIVATATYLGLSIGPVVGGFLLGFSGWRAVHLLNSPVAFIVWMLGMRLLPAAPGKPRQVLDISGVLTLLIGLTALLLAIVQGSQWGSHSVKTWSALLLGLVGLTLFFLIESRSQAPLLDLQLFRAKIFSAAAISALFNYIALFIPTILVPFYLLQGRQLSPHYAGVLLAMQPLAMALTALPSGWLSDHLGARPLSFSGMLILSLGLLGFSLLPATAPLWLVGLMMAIMGTGTGIFISPNSSALMGAAPHQRQGIAAGVLAVARNLGMMLGVALAMAIFHHSSPEQSTTWPDGSLAAFQMALRWASLFALLSAICAGMFGEQKNRR